jgi:integrase/recombinase XerC
MSEGGRRELADFLRFCASVRRLAPMTYAAYERDVSACLDYLQGQRIEDLAEVRVTHLRAFLADEQKRRPAVSSQARTTAALKSFFRFLVEEERLLRDPALPLRTPKKRETLPDVLTMGELERLFAQTGRDELWRHFPGKPERGRLLLALMAYAGLRRSELLGLEWDDVDLSRRLLRVRRAKGGRQRAIPIHPALAPLFAAYYATRVPLTEQSVSVGLQGKPLNYTQLGQVFRHYVDAAGMNERKRVTPHTLRHVFASELLRAGANLRQIQELLGHEHLDSTQRYTRVNAHELHGSIKRLRWVG